MSNEIEVIGQPMSELAMSRPPEVVLAEAQKAAAALKEVISKKSKPVIMNGEQYLEYEDWQTVGHFYGLKVRTGDAVPVEINGVHGAKAQAWVVDLHTGREIGGAEAYCLRDERNWETKPWFQLASMAQTRAGSKSLRNVLAWVVVLAGYKPTPAEEMAGMFPAKPTIPQVRPQSVKPEDGAGSSSESARPPTQQASDAPAQSAAEFARQKAEEMPDDPYVDGLIAKHTLPAPGKSGVNRPGILTIETKDGRSLDMKYWGKNRPSGIGELGNSYCRVFYATKDGQRGTEYWITKLDWIPEPVTYQEDSPEK